MHLIGFLTHGGMKINMAKTDILCLSRHPVQCSFQTNNVTPQQTEKYLGFTFSSGGRQDNELDIRIEKASAYASFTNQGIATIFSKR